MRRSLPSCRRAVSRRACPRGAHERGDRGVIGWIPIRGLRRLRHRGPRRKVHSFVSTGGRSGMWSCRCRMVVSAAMPRSSAAPNAGCGARSSSTGVSCWRPIASCPRNPAIQASKNCSKGVNVAEVGRGDRLLARGWCGAGSPGSLPPSGEDSRRLLVGLSLPRRRGMRKDSRVFSKTVGMRVVKMTRWKGRARGRCRSSLTNGC